MKEYRYRATPLGRTVLLAAGAALIGAVLADGIMAAALTLGLYLYGEGVAP